MTHRTLKSAAAALLACCLTACTAISHAGRTSSMDAEVREFMNGYAADLSGGNREAIAAHYSRTGAHLLRSGSHVLRPFQEIRERYLTTWAPPQAFQWCGLTIFSIPPDAAIVVGLFNWQAADGTKQYSYSALLAREDGELRIRVEDEAPKPETTAAQRCQTAFAHQ